MLLCFLHVGALCSSLCWYLICCVGTFHMALFRNLCALPTRRKRCSDRWEAHPVISFWYTFIINQRTTLYCTLSKAPSQLWRNCNNSGRRRKHQQLEILLWAGNAFLKVDIFTILFFRSSFPSSMDWLLQWKNVPLTVTTLNSPSWWGDLVLDWPIL